MNKTKAFQRTFPVIYVSFYLILSPPFVKFLYYFLPSILVCAYLISSQWNRTTCEKPNLAMSWMAHLPNPLPTYLKHSWAGMDNL